MKAVEWAGTKGGGLWFFFGGGERCMEDTAGLFSSQHDYTHTTHTQQQNNSRQQPFSIEYQQLMIIFRTA